MDVSAARLGARPRWLNTRTVLGLLLFSASFLGGVHFLTRAQTTIPVWAAARDLPPGTKLRSADLRAVEVRLPADAMTGYVAADEAVTGEVLTRSTLEGELLPAGWLATGEAATSGRAMTVPVTPEHAVGGRLRPGDRVDVFGTFEADSPSARTSLLVAGVEIRDIVEAGGVVLDEQATAGVTLSVSAEEAARLAFAIHNAELDIVEVSGSDSPAASETVTERDFR